MAIKAVFLFYYFTWTNENTENPAWDAIEYNVEMGYNEEVERQERPLDKGIIETEKEDAVTFKQRMINKGLKVTGNKERDTCKIECDAIVVGSGCGGGVAAANLAKSGLKVVIIDKGNYFVPRDYSSLEGPSMFEMFESHGLLMTHDGRFRFMAGSTVGGGSVVNWAASLKTPWTHQLELSRGAKIGSIPSQHIRWDVAVWVPQKTREPLMDMERAGRQKICMSVMQVFCPQRQSHDHR